MTSKQTRKNFAFKTRRGSSSPSHLISGVTDAMHSAKINDPLQDDDTKMGDFYEEEETKIGKSLKSSKKSTNELYLVFAVWE